jgi:glucose-1-phosphate thymidylyltransferase
MNTQPKARKGIILAGGSGTRLHPLTLAVSKQILPIYDKPMIYYPLSVLMLADIREILVISTPQDLPCFQRLLGTGENLGVSFSYAEQPEPGGLAQAFVIGANFLGDSPAALVLGDNLFYADHLANALISISAREDVATIFDGRALSIEEKPAQPKSSYAVPGLYFYPSDVVAHASNLKPSVRGELEITDLNKIYLELGQLHVHLLGRGTAWFDTGTHESLLDAATFVAAIQNRQGLQIACVEEIALHKGWISRSLLEKLISTLGRSSYAEYLRGQLANPH